MNGTEYEIVPAEVVRVDFDGRDKEKLYSITCKLMGAYGTQSPFNIVQARALDANIKNIPIEGEVVILMKGPTAYNSANRTGQEFYYTNPVSIQSSVHHNGIPGVTQINTAQTPKDTNARTNARDGLTNQVQNRLQVTKTIDAGFPERLDVYPIQPYSGDIILEGRWGQSIRFGSTVDERRVYPQKPKWKKGLGQTGNPILIISNGTNPKDKPYNEFIIEDPDDDDAAIWMTSGQNLPFKPASGVTPAMINRNVDLYKKNEFAGNQVLIATDRIIFNARRQEILAFSKEGIGLSAEKGITIDGGQVVELESQRINLGINAVSPVLLGDRTLQWLGDLCDALIDAMNAITQQTHPTGTGPSGPPINSGVFNVVKSDLQSLKSGLKRLPSDLVFVCESPGGPSAADEKKAKDREQNGEGYVQTSDERQSAGDRAREVHTPDNFVEERPVVNVVTMITEIDSVKKEKQAIIEELTGQTIQLQPNTSTPPEPEDGLNEGTDSTDGSTDGSTGGTGDTGGTDNLIPGTDITYESLGLKKENLKQNDDGSFDYNGNVSLRRRTVNGNPLNRIPIKFRYVSGNFVCSNMGLSNLENCPTTIDGDFDASENNLKTLQGGPITVGKSYSVFLNDLTSLNGSPKNIPGDFDAGSNFITTLVGGPEKVGKSYSCDNCEQLKSLAGIPREIPLNLYVNGCNLTDETIFDGVDIIRVMNIIDVRDQISGKKLNEEDVKTTTGANYVVIS